MARSTESCFLYSEFSEGRTRHGMVIFIVEIFLLKPCGNSISVRRVIIFTNVKKLNFFKSDVYCNVKLNIPVAFFMILNAYFLLC